MKIYDLKLNKLLDLVYTSFQKEKKNASNMRKIYFT